MRGSNIFSKIVEISTKTVANGSGSGVTDDVNDEAELLKRVIRRDKRWIRQRY